MQQAREILNPYDTNDERGREAVCLQSNQCKSKMIFGGRINDRIQLQFAIIALGQGLSVQIVTIASACSLNLQFMFIRVVDNSHQPTIPANSSRIRPRAECAPSPLQSLLPRAPMSIPQDILPIPSFARRF